MKNFNSKKFILCLIALIIVGVVIIRNPEQSPTLSISIIGILTQFGWFNTKEKKDAADCNKGAE